jgi:hypothetical protein
LEAAGKILALRYFTFSLFSKKKQKTQENKKLGAMALTTPLWRQRVSALPYVISLFHYFLKKNKKCQEKKKLGAMTLIWWPLGAASAGQRMRWAGREELKEEFSGTPRNFQTNGYRC